MSKMYGNRRVVLNNKPTRLGNRLVCICGSTGQGGLYHPIGYWYQEAGLYWVDLKSPDQWYSEVSKDTIANKRFAGVPTKQALRKFVMNYWNAQEVPTSNRDETNSDRSTHLDNPA